MSINARKSVFKPFGSKNKTSFFSPFRLRRLRPLRSLALKQLNL